MNKLLSYYQKELSFLKQHGKVFAIRYPKIARRLGIVEGESEDPHVSRLVESFALLTSRIHQRLDEDMPEVIESLLTTLAPQFLRTMPSACIVMIEPDPLHSGITGKNILPAETMLFTRHNIPLPCQFQTAYSVTLLPLSIHSASLYFDSDELSWQLQLCFQVWPGATLAGESIRLYLHGPDNVVNILYTLLSSEIKGLTLQQNGISTTLNSDALSQVGFESGEALLTRDPQIAPVHILLLDYFWFPQKFSFIDIQLPTGFSATSKESFELQVLFKHNPLTEQLEKLAPLVGKDFFRLHCTPAVNLFSLSAEPITLTDAMAEHPIIPDTRYKGKIDVWAVNHVSVQRKVDGRLDHFPVKPLLEKYHYSIADEDSGLYWQIIHRDTPELQDIELKPFIAFSEHPTRQPPAGPEIVTINLMCTNNKLAHQMQYGLSDGDFDTDAPVAGLKIVALTHPTLPITPPGKSETLWRFLSQLSLNHQLLDGDQGAQRLKDTLALYISGNGSEKSRLFNLIQDLTCQPITARLINNDPNSLARGISITLTFTNNARLEPDYFLFCSMLDRLLALYAPVNSFTRLTTCIERDTQACRVWPIRAGKLSWL